MDTDIDQLLRRFESCCLAVRRMQHNPEIHRDCRRMVKATQLCLEDVSRLGVDCRRMGRITATYQEMLDRARESVHNLERYVMMAQLMI